MEQSCCWVGTWGRRETGEGTAWHGTYANSARLGLLKCLIRRLVYGKVPGPGRAFPFSLGGLLLLIGQPALGVVARREKLGTMENNVR